jgi:WhiB family redox-sensing transcriptional regulator
VAAALVTAVVTPLCGAGLHPDIPENRVIEGNDERVWQRCRLCRTESHSRFKDVARARKAAAQELAQFYGPLQFEITASRWHERAACRGKDPELFVIPKGKPSKKINEAKQICATCPVKSWCLADALVDPNTRGVRAGLFLPSEILQVVGSDDDD